MHGDGVVVRPSRLLFFSPCYPLKPRRPICAEEGTERAGEAERGADAYLREPPSSESRVSALLITGDFFLTFVFVKIMNNTSFLQLLKATAKSGWCTCSREKKKKQMPISSFLRSLYCYAWLKLQNRKTECFFSPARLYNKETMMEMG